MTDQVTKVIVLGASGKMGRVSVATIEASADFQLVATVGRGDDLEAALRGSGAQLAIDFTTPDSVFANAQLLIKHGVHPVIGATGLAPPQIAELTDLCRQRHLGAIIAPNFSIAAVLMMRASAEIARYLPHCEIIELHHPHKLDSPSGTAKKTAQMIVASNPQAKQQPDPSLARGSYEDGIATHSVRLPGLFAHQTVLFGNQGESLTLRYDGMDRQCCMPGLLLACRRVVTLDHLVYGLDQLI